MRARIQSWLGNTHPYVFAIYAMAGAFITYFSMYAFRKPFSAATFDSLELWGIDYKVIAIVTQVCGYALSKFVGIKVISEMRPEVRIRAILVLIGIAWLALFFFAAIPYPWNVVFLFMNGLPLGMIWGVVFSFLEGRRFTELLGSGLCASFIVSSGFVKAVGRELVLNFGVSEFWMPFVTGILFLAPLLLGVFMLSTIPPQTESDQEDRTSRVPMTGEDRKRFLGTFTIGVIFTTVVYMLLTIFRDIRDNFTVEIWRALGYGDTPHLLATAEVPVAVLVLIFMGLMSFVKSHRTAFYINFHIVILTGFLLILTTLLFQSGGLHPIAWMIINGFCMYLAYIAYHTFLYERWIALFRYKSNIGYLMYIADAFGYLGAITVMLLKNFSPVDLGWYEVFIKVAYFTGFSTVILGLLCIFYFKQKERILI